MKTKLILGLALVLSSGIMLTSRAEAQSTDVPPASTNSVILTNSETTSLTPWIAETNCLYFWKDSAPGMVSGKQSIYQFQFSPGHPIDLPVSVFVDNKTGRFWAGRRANLYVETDAGIFGMCLPLDGYLRFDASLIHQVAQGENLDALIDQFKKQITPSLVLKPAIHGIDLRSPLNPWFFTAVPYGSQPGCATIKHIKLDGKKLQLDLVSPTGVYKASVWIDLKTWKLVKAVEDGKKVFPK
jgi:hypothetical protein